jgi:hypothetical protein
MSKADDHALAIKKLELRYQFRFRMINFATQSVDRMIPAVMVVFVVYFGLYGPVQALAGKKTLADFGVKLLAEAKLSEIIPYVTAAMGWLFGVNAQRLRRNTTERLTNRIRELEQRIDPTRSTSGLTPRGQTPSDTET